MHNPAVNVMGNSENEAGTALTKLELAIEGTDLQSIASIGNVLESCSKVLSYKTDPIKQSITVESTLPSNKVVELIESAGANDGNKAVIVGIGSASTSRNLGAAVAIMHEGNPASGIRGVTRVVQTSPDTCVIDGTLDGLAPDKEFSVAVHEYGDLSSGCTSCGNPMGFNSSSNDKSSYYGFIGDMKSDGSGKTNFKIVNNKIKVWEIIGRSMVLSEVKDNVWCKLACGIVARSAGLFENSKKICACDGVTIWEERDLPVAGPSRSKKS